ncbi:S-adenosyl-L-methionine-dependent methyltransferase [Xylariaceae sp. FL1019]|nr:S-adenosyl-L-methionine-dependent methyltransferase [Xylariaceae sp. FL1019]
MASVDQMISSLRAIDASSLSVDDRLRLLDEVRGTLRRVQSPWDIAWDHAWVHGATMAAITSLINASLFTKWAEAGNKPMTTPELAELIGVDASLLKRLLRQVAGDNLVGEVGEDTYAPTPWSTRLGTESSFASIYKSFYYDIVLPLWKSLPSFFKKAGYDNPTELTNSNFQYTHGEGSTFFSYVASREETNQAFADAMGCHSEGNFTSWVDLYDTDEMVQASKPDRALIVDIGGSKGHDIEKFLQKHPDVPKDKLILQDLPEVLAKFTIHPGITPYPYDFFTPQPIKGARAYYYHIVLHDWPDVTATKILETVRDAMEPGYSRILLHEVLVPENKASLTVATLDVTMMALFSALERSEKQWYQLIDGVEGLRIVKIWKARHAVESLIEIERV